MCKLGVDLPDSNSGHAAGRRELHDPSLEQGSDKQFLCEDILKDLSSQLE